MVNKGKGCITSIFDGSIPIGVIKHGLETIFTKPIEPPVGPTIDYITDGLIANFSGEDNYKDGAWVDRVSGYKFTPVSETTAPIYVANRMYYEADKFGGMVSDFKLPANSQFTVEVVVRDITDITSTSLNSYYATLIGGEMDGGEIAASSITIAKFQPSYNNEITVGVVNNNALQGYSTQPDEYENNALDTLTIIPEVGVYRNGVRVSDVGPVTIARSLGLFTHAVATSNREVNYRGKGKIHAVRIYNRQLTADEVVANYNKDIEIYGATYGTDGYVTDGLTALFSGEDNYSNGAWLDRVSGYKFTPVSTSTAPVFEADNKLYNATQFGGMESNFKLPATSSYTIEIVARDIKNLTGTSLSSGYGALLGGEMDGYNIALSSVAIAKFYRTYGQEIIVGLVNNNKLQGYVALSDEVYTDNALDTFTIIPEVGIYRNGVRVADCGSASVARKVGLFIHATGSYRSSYRGKGKIHAVRYYDKQLTEEQIAQNYAEDVRIYGG